jgi:hypothetical protein
MSPTSTVAATPDRGAAAPRERRRRRTRPESPPSQLLVAALIAFLALEYLRPPPLQPLKLQMLFLAVMPFLWLFSKERPWSLNLTLQLLFLITGAMAIPYATNYFVVYMNARLMFGCVVIALSVTWLLAWRANFRRVLWAWIAIVCFQAIWGTFHDGQGYGSMFGDENDLALACDVAIPFALLGARFLRGGKRWACIGVALLLVVGCVVSWSRGGFLGLVAATLYAILAVGRHPVRNMAIAVVFGVVFYLVVPSSYKTEMETIRDTDQGTAETRLFIWSAATGIWLDNPIFGAGPDNASFLLGRHQPDPTKGGMFSQPVFRDKDWSMTAIHSVYFQLLADRGLVGVSLFAWVGVAFFVGLRRLRRDVGRAAGSIPRDLERDALMYAFAMEAAMVGFLVAGAFLSMAYYPYFWFLSALAVAHERAIRRELVPRARREMPPAPKASEEPARPSTWTALLQASRRGESGRLS